MGAKQYLNSLGEFDEQIGRKIRRLCELGAAGMFSEEELKYLRSARGLYTKDKFDDLRNEITDDVAKLRRMRRDTVDLLKRLGNTRYAGVLYKHYVEYKSIKEISEEMFLSCSHTHMLHKKALDALENLL